MKCAHHHSSVTQSLAAECPWHQLPN